MAVNIYEARNNTLREIWVGVTELDVDSLPEQHRRSRHASIVHWDYAKHQIQYVEIERAMGEADARNFVKAYATNTPIPGWKMLIA